MNVLDALFNKQMAQYSRDQRRALIRAIDGVGHKKPRSSRRCFVCHEVTPTYRLIKPGAGRPQMCKSCRDHELAGEVK